MLRTKLLVVIAVMLGAVVLLGSCKNGAKEAARLQAQQDSIAQAKAAQREADSLAALEAARAAEAAEAAAEEAAVNQPDPSLKFHVIVGGFVIQSNADNYLAQMQSQYSAAKLFVAPNGFKLVSVGDFATYAEALQMMRGLGRSDLWVYEEGGPYDTTSWLENRDDMEDEGSDYTGGQTPSGGPVDEFDM